MTSTAASCGGGGGGASREGGAVKSVVEQLAEWVGLWSDDAERGVRRPPSFEVPAPPPVVLASAATRIQEDVVTAAGPLAALRGRVWKEDAETAANYTKETLCEWFAWYVEDRQHTVPTADDFVFFFAKAGLKINLSVPVSKELQDASDLFRSSILRAKDEDDQGRNAAMAAVCSLPFP